MEALRFCLALSLTMMLGGPPLCASRGQSSSLIGAWRIDFLLGEVATHAVRFEALEGGSGRFILLDQVSNLIPSPPPTSASWRQVEGGGFIVTGPIEFPIGNVGRESGTLTFIGNLDEPPSAGMSGQATFRSSVQDRTVAGLFHATRIESEPKVHVTQPEPGTRVKRGGLLSILWEVNGEVEIAQQEVSLSLDGGTVFSPIGVGIGGEIRAFTWNVPPDMEKARKALVRIVITDSAGDNFEGVSSQPFRIK